MTAGLPGTGIGGLFYLLAALLLPIRLAWLVARGRSERGHLMLAIRHLAMAVSMIAAVWLTGALLGLWRPLPPIVTVAPIALTFGTLPVILVAVEIGRLVIRPPAGFERGRLSRRALGGDGETGHDPRRDPALDGQATARVLDVTDRVAPAKSRRNEWTRPRDRDAAPPIRMRREREEPPIARA